MEDLPAEPPSPSPPPPPPPPAPGPRWKGTDVLAVWVFGLFVAVVVLAAALGFGWLDPNLVQEGEQLSRTVAITGGAQFGAMLLGLRYLSSRRGTGNMIADYRLRFQGGDTVAIAWGLGLGLVLALVLGGVLSLLDIELDSQESVEAVEQASQVWETIVLVLVIVLLAPLVEEMIFRGILHEVLRRRFTVRGASWIGGTIFGIVHLLDPAAAPLVPLLIILGVVLGYVRERAGNLGKPVLMHLGFNLLTVVTILSS